MPGVVSVRTPFLLQVDLAPTTCGTPPPPVSLYASTLKDGSKHVLNAQVSIRAPCCKQWFDCAECHAETQSHKLAKSTEMTFICKKCKKAFRKDTTEFDESDEYCPHCDNHFVRVGSATFAVATERSVLGTGRCDTQSCVKSGRRGPETGCKVRALPHPAVSRSSIFFVECSKTNVRRSTQAARSTIKMRRTGWGDLRISAWSTTTNTGLVPFPAIPARAPLYEPVPTLTFPTRHRRS